ATVSRAGQRRVSEPSTTDRVGSERRLWKLVQRPPEAESPWRTLALLGNGVPTYHVQKAENRLKSNIHAEKARFKSSEVKHPLGEGEVQKARSSQLKLNIHAEKARSSQLKLNIHSEKAGF
ncbi:hypothetical protein BaRGS_00018142, partial [Batillaria attramentaria]